MGVSQKRVDNKLSILPKESALEIRWLTIVESANDNLCIWNVRQVAQNNLAEVWNISAFHIPEKKDVISIETQLKQIQEWVLAIHNSFNDVAHNCESVSIDKNNLAIAWIDEFIDNVGNLRVKNANFNLLIAHNAGTSLHNLKQSLGFIRESVVNWKIEKNIVESVLPIIDRGLFTFCTGFYSLFHWVKWANEEIVSFNLKNNLVKLKSSMSSSINKPKLVLLGNDNIPDIMINWKMWTILNAIANIIRNAKKHWRANCIRFSYIQNKNNLTIRMEDDWFWIKNPDLSSDLNKMFDVGFSAWWSSWVWLASLPEQLSIFWAKIVPRAVWDYWWAGFDIVLDISK